MAQLDQATHADIEKLFDLLEWQWGRLPDVEADIGQWDWTEQVVFVEEWPLEEDRLQRLQQYASEGALTPAQQARYAALLQLVEQNRPIIRRLQAS